MENLDDPARPITAMRQLRLENQVLRAAVDYFAHGDLPRIAYPLVSDLASGGVPVASACAALGFSPQAYYAWRANPVSDRDWEDAETINVILTIHLAQPQLGYRMITKALHQRGVKASPGRVYRLCAQQQIKAATDLSRPEQHGRGAQDDGPVDLRFNPTAPNRLWLTGVTHTPTPEGNVYLCAVIDAYSKAIVGWAVGDHMTAQLAVEALERAVTAHHPTGALVHSNWGSQFRSDHFTDALRRAGLRASMGKIGPDTDETVAESLFRLLHTDVLDHRTWNTKAELRAAIVLWIERRGQAPVLDGRRLPQSRSLK